MCAASKRAEQTKTLNINKSLFLYEFRYQCVLIMQIIPVKFVSTLSDLYEKLKP